MDWSWAAACVQRAGQGHIVSPRAQLIIFIIIVVVVKRVNSGV